MARVAARPPIVVIAAGGNELSAVQAMRLGAADYLPRRLLNAQRLANALRTLLRPERAANGSAAARKRARRRIGGGQLDLPQYSMLHKLGESSRAARLPGLQRHARAQCGAEDQQARRSIAGEECQEFAREYAAISALQNPAVVDIYDYGFHDGREFIAMEYFPCGDLKTRLQQPITITREPRVRAAHLRRTARWCTPPAWCIAI